MCDSTGQPSDRLHLLCQVEFSLEQSPFGYVLGEDFDVGAVFILRWPTAAMYRDEGAVLPLSFHFDVLEIPGAQGHFDQFLVFCRMAIDTGGEVDCQQFLLRLITQHLFERRIDHEECPR